MALPGALYPSPSRQSLGGNGKWVVIGNTGGWGGNVTLGKGVGGKADDVETNSEDDCQQFQQQQLS